MYYNNRRLILNIFWIVLGVVLFGLSVAEVLDSSFCAGMGGGLIAVGILRTVRTFRYRKDPEYREKIDTEAGDERNRFLRMKSWSWAGYIVVLIEGAGVIVATVLGNTTVQQVLSWSVCLILAVWWIS